VLIAANATTEIYGFTASPTTGPIMWVWVTPVPLPTLSPWQIIVTYLQALYR